MKLVAIVPPNVGTPICMILVAMFITTVIKCVNFTPNEASWYVHSHSVYKLQSIVGMFTLCRGGGSTLALVRQNIVRYTSMLDWKKDWYGGIDYGMDYGITAIPNSTV